MKTIVIYNSKTGFSEKYGKWIAEELSCEPVSYQALTEEKLKGIDTVIYGAGITAGIVNGWKKIKENPALKGKKLIVYAVGAVPMEASDFILNMKNANFTSEEQKSIPFFYFAGGIAYEKMSFASKMMLKTMYKVMKNKKDRSEEETGMMLAIEKSRDDTKRGYIKPLIEEVK